MKPAGQGGQVIAELVSAGLITVGLVLFFIACAMAWTTGSWRKTTAVVDAAEGETILRWHNNRYEICQAQLSPQQSASVKPGGEVFIHYQQRAPENWSFTSPHRRARKLGAAGIFLALIGTAASVIGFADAIG